MSDLPFDIFVPSKGRPDGSTFALLNTAKLPFTVVIEKNDVGAYEHVSPQKIILPKSNQGIGYSRSYITANAQRPFVMMDDDITRVCKRNPHKSSIQDVPLRKMLMAGWKQLFISNAGVLGFKHGTFAIPKTELSMYCIVAHIVFIKPDHLRKSYICYDPKLHAFEDIDLIFQCCQKQVQVIRLNRYIYFTTPSGTAKRGGVSYTSSTKKKALSVIEQRYPGWIRATGGLTSHNQPKYEIKIPR